MRKRATLSLWIVSVAATLLAAPALGQQPEAEAALEGIDRSLKQIVELLKIQVANQRAGLAVRRLDIARRELVARERELHDAERDRDGHARQQKEILARLETYGARDFEGSGMSEEDFEFVRRQLDIEAEAIKQELWRTDQRIIDLQTEIRRVREDLEAWEELVAESAAPD